MKEDAGKMKKIVVMHRASIGDMLLATPVYREIKNTYPHAQLVLVTSYAGKELMQGNPYIDHMMAYEKGDSWLRIVKAIWRADAAIILDHHYRNALFAFLAMIPKRIGRGKDFVNVHVEPREQTKPIYEPMNHLRLAEFVGVYGKDTSLEPLCPSEQERKHVRNILRENLVESGKLVLMAPYSLDSLKDWEPAKYRETAERLQEKGCAVAIIGGKENRQRAEQDFPGIVNLVGLTNLRETYGLISESDLLLCGCTSVLHICATTATHAVAIYGPSSPASWAPRKNCTVVSREFPCSPCHNIKFPPCNDNQCIKSISVDEVWEQVARLI